MIKTLVYKFSEKGIKVKVSSYKNCDSERISQNKALFKFAIWEAMESKTREIEAEIKDVEVLPPSIDYKIKMNSLFREKVGGDFVPFPEAEYSVKD